MSLAGLKKQLNKANQYLSETIGGAKGTELDAEFAEMERKVIVKCMIDPFFSANIGLIKNLRPPWCCYFNVLSRNTSLEKIKTTFRKVHRGQRSNKVISVKFTVFPVIFAFLAKKYALEQVYGITVLMTYHIIPV